LNRNTKRKSSGFTLVEIMIVTMIIGLILAIAIPNYLNAKRDSMKYTCIGNLRQIDSAKSIWATENLGTPEMEDLVPDYIRKTPECPSGGEYTLAGIGSDSTCDIPGHAIDGDA